MTTRQNKKDWLIIILLMCSFALALFFAMYGKVTLFPAIDSLIISMKEKEAVQIGNYLKNTLIDDLALFRQETLPVENENIIKNAALDFALLKIKVFDAAGRTLFSTSAEDIGVVNQSPYFHNHVAKGNTLTYLVHKEDPSLEDQAYGRDLVETYIPIMENGKFHGAFEIYYDISKEKQLLNQLIRNASLLAGGVSLLLFILAISITIQAKRYLHLIQDAKDKVSQRNNELYILYDLSKVLGRSLPVDALLQNVLQTLLSHLAFLDIHRRGVAFLCHNNTMEIIAQLGVDPKHLSCQQGLDPLQCLCGKCANEGGLVIVDHCQNALNEQEKVPLSSYDHGHIILPLKTEEKVFAVLCLYTRPDITVSEDYHELLESIGNQVGVAVERSLAYSELKEVSLHDPLTGLPNRRLMEDCLQQELSLFHRYKREFSIIMADIDHFKNYNDQFGHAAGDKLLCSIAKIMQDTVRDSDLVARYGGEEFLLVLPETNSIDAVLVAEKVRHNIELNCEVCISCGVAEFRTKMTLSGLIEIADKALYSAKESGRNRVVSAC